MQLTVSTPKDFNFQRTVMSHGWCALPPFDFDKTKWTLTRVIDLGTQRPITATISSAKSKLLIKTSRTVGKSGAEKIKSDVRHMFRLDDDMAEFYGRIAQEPDFAWIAAEGAGRLLRAPTVFEDLVKMICTTNCSWALTEIMVKALVKELGRESDDGRKSFPTAEAMAAKSEKFYRDKIRSGYRAPYLRELAQRVASGELDVESWLKHGQSRSSPTVREGSRHSGSSPTVRAGSRHPGSSPTVREGVMSHDDLMKELKRVKGVGNYAAENLLKLIGRYDGLALDSWTRAQFAALRNNGRVASDKKIARYYSRFGSWRGLVLWCDMTRHWLEPERILNW